MPRVKHWTIEEALPLIRAMQPVTRNHGYHLCLGGGVLNKGMSEKDLDLYFLPMGSTPSDPPALLAWLTSIWGESTAIGAEQGYPEEEGSYIHRRIFRYSDLRIDVFIVGTPAPVDVEGLIA